jgi:uncharacterized glyoxalase superfamily protein PhnB
MHNNIIPFLRYDDAPAAITWLGRAFGADAVEVHEGPDNTIGHAELRIGAGMIMLGSRKDDLFGMRSPRALGGVNQGIYICVLDPDAVYATAAAAGADVLIPIRDESYGGRGFVCRDPEGNLWSFGSYLPPSLMPQND